ncbi:hypothetical protein SI859A1_00482 [Aurantimonas manganoxydans SI85-9A1]|uniref:Uncharacterized protein n=1 Tax=Aurantimonas manganoxydans (strain ATCC BAA-1229 / DSM 21871 / SI85-9A1) TaxID=287752 RepID=Q1YGV8_AURMS|nr:hypothetical protein SI859A1_00482 [Aurantimonas manganoxydans SI85-9A1]
MTTAPPISSYSAMKGADEIGDAIAELHHLWGHDLDWCERSRRAMRRRKARRACIPPVDGRQEGGSERLPDLPFGMLALIAHERGLLVDQSAVDTIVYIDCR